MRAREDGQRVGADLVRDVPVRGDPVRPDDHGVDAGALHQRAGRIVGDQRCRDPRPQQLPRGEPGALEDRTGLTGDHVDPASLLVRAPEHAERRPIPRRRQHAGVAVREHPGAGLEERRPVLADPAVGLEIRAGQRVRGVEQPLRERRRVVARARDLEHPVDGPAQVHRGGPGGAQDGRRAAHRPETFGQRAGAAGVGRHDQAVGRGEADRRGTPHPQLANRVGDLLPRPAPERPDLVGEPGLIEEAERSVLPPQRGVDGHPRISGGTAGRHDWMLLHRKARRRTLGSLSRSETGSPPPPPRGPVRR